MDDSSTKPGPVSIGLAILRSRRMRGLIFLLVSLVGLYFMFTATTKHLSSTESGRVDLNGDGEPMDITQGERAVLVYRSNLSLFKG